MKNRGMYIEELIKKTISYYNENNIGIFEKRQLPIKVASIIKNKVTGYLEKKSFVDFVGVYQGFHIEFESKQTNNNYFKINQFLDHQLKHLIKCMYHSSISFVIIHFFNENLTFAIEIGELMQISHKLKKKSIPLEYFKKNCYCVKIVFPGVLEIIDYINILIKKYHANK